MTNQVDISSEAIAKEWEKLAADHKISLEPETVEEAEIISETPEPDTGTGEGLFDNMDGVEVETGPVPGPGSVAKATITDDEQIQMARTIIAGGVTFLIKVGMHLDTDQFKEQIDDLAQSYAEVITKYYKGGIFEFLARFKHEIAAIGATIALIGAIRKAKKLEHREEKEVSNAD